MIQRCPKCGAWCETYDENMLDRGLSGIIRHIDGCGEVGNELGGKFGKRVGQLVGIQTSFVRGVNDALFGNKYQFECSCGHTWGTDNDEEDETEYFEQERYVEELVNEYYEIDVDDEKSTDYLDRLLDASDSEYNTEFTISMINDTLAALFLEKSYSLDDDTKKEEGLALALNAINKSLSLFDDANSHIIKGFILAESNKYSYYSALKELFYSREIERHTYFTIDSINNTYKNICEGYEEDFLEIPKEQRKYLVLVDKYVTIPDNFKVLRMANIPDNLKLLGDNILKNTLYVIHPLKNDTYIPVNDYAIELFREQLYEYREIMECLGAKTFSIKDVHSNNSENSKDTTYKVGGGGECKGYSAKGSYESKENTEQYKQLYNELSQEVKCELSRQPFIPENTLWYQHKSDWQRNCDSRIAGRMLVFKQNVTNRISTGLTKQDSKMIEGEFNSMIAKLNGSYESDAKFSLKEDAEHTWEISVEFYPMSEYNTHTEQKPSLQLSSNEEKYIATVKTYLEEDGVISPKERRLLETLSESLGISNQRAKELESLLIVPKSSKRKWWQKIF